MKLENNSVPHSNVIHSYDDAGIKVNEELITNSFIIMPDRLITNWRPSHFSDLIKDDFDQLADLAPEIIILGAGKKLVFPEQELLKTVISKNIGFEVMDTYAACRCYSILLSEGRNVAAGLLLDAC